MKRVIRRYELTDEEWEHLKKYFPERQPGTMGRPRKEPRETLEAVKLRPGMAVLAEKAYGRWELRKYIADHGTDFCIPPKCNKSDPWFVDWLPIQRAAFGGNLFPGTETVSSCRYPL